MRGPDNYEVEIDHLDDDVPCRCGDCGHVCRYAEVSEIGDCSLTPGDPSPAGRCPLCDTLAYPDRPLDKARDNAQDLADKLILLVPYIEDIQKDQAYKPGVVKALLDGMKVLLTDAGQLP